TIGKALSFLAVCLCLGVCALSAAEASPEISGNPGAVEIETGTGALGEVLGIPKDSGIRLGGLWITDYNYLIAGGISPHKGSGNNLLQLGANVKTEPLGWEGGLFDIEFLQFDGRPTNAEAGSIQGYNSLPGPPPLDRSELYQLWYRQELFA